MINLSRLYQLLNIPRLRPSPRPFLYFYTSLPLLWQRLFCITHTSPSQSLTYLRKCSLIGKSPGIIFHINFFFSEGSWKPKLHVFTFCEGYLLLIENNCKNMCHFIMLAFLESFSKFRSLTKHGNENEF